MSSVCVCVCVYIVCFVFFLNNIVFVIRLYDFLCQSDNACCPNVHVGRPIFVFLYFCFLYSCFCIFIIGPISFVNLLSMR